MKLTTRMTGSRAVLRICFTLGAALLCACPIFSQPSNLSPDWMAKPIALTVQRQSLSDITAILSAQLGLSIVADGEPLTRQADVELNGTAKEALDRVADIFDYTWMPLKSGVILMRKRFKNPDDYPQMNLEEMRQMAREIVAVLQALPFDPNPAHENAIITELFRSFTPAQVLLLRSGRVLRGSELSVQQLNLLQQAVLSSYFSEPCSAWTLLLAQLDSMPQSFLQMREWPTFYQKRMGLPVEPVKGIPNHWQFTFVGKDQNGGELITCLPWQAPQPRLTPKFQGGQ